MSEAQNEPLSKADAITQLRETIAQLETIVNQLDAEVTEDVPARNAFASLVNSTQELAASLEKEETILIAPEVPSETPSIEPEQPEEPAFTTPETRPALEEEQASEALEAPLEETEEDLAPLPLTESPEEISTPTSPSVFDRVLPNFRSFQTAWDTLLDTVRSVLPTSISENLPNWAITGVLTGLVVAILTTGVLLFPKPTTEIAEIPPAVETPPELKAPRNPELISEIPPPQPKLTPEQSLIAAIQNQVADLTNQYAEGLIDSIEANFLGSYLSVTVNEKWYELSSSRQDKLANQIFNRSQDLDFGKLEMTDLDGDLVARNPVVGNKMVILQRER